MKGCGSPQIRSINESCYPILIPSIPPFDRSNGRERSSGCVKKILSLSGCVKKILTLSGCVKKILTLSGCVKKILTLSGCVKKILSLSGCV